MEKKINILLVEDDAFDVQMFEHVLKKVSSTATLTHAADGLAALEMIRSGAVAKPYVVVADINMPRMSGHDLLECLRHEDSGSNDMVFMLSTSDSPQDIQRAYHSRANGYIVKPSSREGLSKVISCLNDFWNTCEVPAPAF